MTPAFVAGDVIPIIVTPQTGANLLNFSTATSVNLVAITDRERSFPMAIAPDGSYASYTTAQADFPHGGVYALQVQIVYPAGPRSVSLGNIVVDDKE